VRFPFGRSAPQPPIILVPAVHTTDAWGFDRPNLLRLTRVAYATVAHTDHERDWLIAKGAPPARVRVIGHGIDPTQLTPRVGAFRNAHGIDSSGFLVAFVGQQGRHKGIDTLLEAFVALVARHPEAWLAVAGSRTPFTGELERLVARLPEPVRRRVRLVTGLTEQEKADVLGDCDVFASPSSAESFGITTLEAWAVHKPVVVGDLPSQRCVVEDGVSGMLVAPGDPGSLLAALERLTDAHVRGSIGEAGYRRLTQRFVRQDVERAYAELFRDAVRESSGTA
jgi:starch synthase